MDLSRVKEQIQQIVFSTTVPVMTTSTATPDYSRVAHLLPSNAAPTPAIQQSVLPLSNEQIAMLANTFSAVRQASPAPYPEPAVSTSAPLIEGAAKMQQQRTAYTETQMKASHVNQLGNVLLTQEELSMYVLKIILIFVVKDLKPLQSSTTHSQSRVPNAQEGSQITHLGSAGLRSILITIFSRSATLSDEHAKPCLAVGFHRMMIGRQGRQLTALKMCRAFHQCFLVMI